MNKEILHSVYLSFSEEVLGRHFAPVAGSPLEEQIARHLRYYKNSVERYSEFEAKYKNRRGLPITKMRRPCQIEKDERFWTATCLLKYYYNQDRIRYFAALLSKAFSDVPPILGTGSWEECLTGDLFLFFETNLPSPKVYRMWLQKHIKEQTLVPYVRHAAFSKDRKQIKRKLEGATNVDALLLNADTGFAVIFEAKVLSDISYQVTFNITRNQIARSIDVMLEPNPTLLSPLNARKPEETLFVLLTPEILRKRPSSRLYGWVFERYKTDPEAIARDLPHRKGLNWLEVADRIGWLTWEDCTSILPDSCPWLKSS